MSTKADLKNCRTGAEHKPTSGDWTEDTKISITHQHTFDSTQAVKMCNTFDFMAIISMASAYLKFSCFWLIELSPFSGHTYFRLEMMSGSSISAICSEQSLSPRPTSHWETLQHLRTSCGPRSVRVFSRWTPIETKEVLWTSIPNEWTYRQCSVVLPAARYTCWI